MSKINEMVNGYRAAAAAFWSVRTEQERKMLAIGGAVVVLGLVYGLLIDPAFSGRARLARDLPKLNQQVAELQALAGEASQLATQAPLQVQPLTRESIAASLQTRGLAPAQPAVVTGEFVKLEFKGVAFAGLVTWLDTVRRENHLSVQDASITAQSPAGQVDATLTLRQDAGAR